MDPMIACVILIIIALVSAFVCIHTHDRKIHTIAYVTMWVGILPLLILAAWLVIFRPDLIYPKFGR